MSRSAATAPRRRRLGEGLQRLLPGCHLQVLNSFASVFTELMFAHRARATKLAEPPLFVLGHWRSGTTLLHELLIRDERHTYPNTYECFAPHHFIWTEWFVPPLLRKLLPSTRPMDAMEAGWERPQEDEFALCNLGIPTPYLAWAFPQHGPVHDEYLDLVGLSNAERERWKEALKSFVHYVASMRNRRIILKSPTHTARVKTLLEVFPDARFVRAGGGHDDATHLIEDAPVVELRQHPVGLDKAGLRFAAAIDLAVDAVEIANLVRIQIHANRNARGAPTDNRIDEPCDSNERSWAVKRLVRVGGPMTLFYS
ncbi:MAG: sulfotransferase [Aquincola sp.]|nr:sulfotransferase [Aquincola sp.]